MEPPLSGESSGVSEVPLFPLPLVLFPHMLLPLHIFEERYKDMINHCVSRSLPFGIVLTSDGETVTGEAATHAIGCTARIARVERLPDGCMNIEVVGEKRFRLLDTHESEPYRVGLVETMQDAPTDTEAVVTLAEEVQKLLRDYLTRTLALMGRREVEFDLPDEPEVLSFTAACVLPVENDDKQSLLEDTDTAARLSAERDVLIREVTRLRRADEAEGNKTAPEWKQVRASRFESFVCSN